jgi:hypothetical protein
MSRNSPITLRTKRLFFGRGRPVPIMPATRDRCRRCHMSSLWRSSIDGLKAAPRVRNRQRSDDGFICLPQEARQPCSAMLPDLSITPAVVVTMLLSDGLSSDNSQKPVGTGSLMETPPIVASAANASDVPRANERPIAATKSRRSNSAGGARIRHRAVI